MDSADFRGMALLMALALAPALTTGCSSDGAGDDDGSDDGAGDDALDPPAPEGGQQLASAEYTLQPGEEKYLCYTFESPADAERAITNVQPIPGVLVHHTLLAETLADEPTEPFECPELIKVSWQPIWAAGAGDAPLTLPEGVGFKVRPATQYLIQYHLLNASDAPITERSGINLTYAPDASAVETAGIFALGSFELEIPAATLDYTQTVSCEVQVQEPMNVFAVFPHMHQLGSRLDLEHGASEGELAMVYQKDPWQFGDQPMDPLTLEVAPGDHLRSTCHWDNPGSEPVGFGESSGDEMCFTVLFYWPSPGTPRGCVD